MHEPTTTPRIDVSFQTIDDLLDEVQGGRLRVPAFQRPFRWKPTDMVDLFDSIIKGYPIGSILLWRPVEAPESSRLVGPIQIPPSGRDPKLIVDGHQRIATLFGALRISTKEPFDHESLWPWLIYYDLSTRKFIQIRRGTPSPWQLPLRLLRRTTELLTFADQLRRAPLPPGVPGVDDLLDEADALSQRMKGYKLLLMTLENGGIEDAVESFSRMNGKGRDISGHETMSALTYRQGQFHLDRRIEDISRQLAEVGFAGVPSNGVLRAILAISGARDVYRTDWALVAKDMKEGMADYVSRGETALLQAAQLLRGFGVETGRLLPYIHQLVFLAVYFDQHPHPTEAHKRLLERWFWGTSFAESFAGISASETSRWLKAMRGEDFEKTLSVSYSAEPYPSELRLSSARARVHILTFLQMCKPRGPDGSPLNVLEIKAFESRGGLPYIFEDAPEAERSDPANRAIWPSSKDVGADLLRMTDEVLRSHAIDGLVLKALRDRQAQAFVELRRSALQDVERQFMARFGILPPTRDAAEPMTDTEEGEG